MTNLRDDWSCRKIVHGSKVKGYKVNVLLKMLSIVCMGNEADHSMTVIVSQIVFISVKF